jgi:hypothetical protein
LRRNQQTETHLVLRLKPRNCRGDFDAQVTKSELPILRPKPGDPPPPWFWGSTKKPTTGFEANPGETVATNFEAKQEKIIATGFEAKPAKTVRVVLRPNHSQTINLAFKAQPRNMCSSSPRARCKSHTAPPNLSIAWPPSTRHVWSSLVLCTNSPIPTMILITARHAAPATYTPRDKQTWFSKWNKDKKKKKIKLSLIRIQTSPSQWLIIIKPMN